MELRRSNSKGGVTEEKYARGMEEEAFPFGLPGGNGTGGEGEEGDYTAP